MGREAVLLCDAATAPMSLLPDPLPPHVLWRLLGSEFPLHLSCLISRTHTFRLIWPLFTGMPKSESPRGSYKGHIFISVSQGPATAWHRKGLRAAE